MRIARVNGRSLAPELPNGAFAVFRPVKNVQRGHIILACHPDFGMVVKKVATITRKGRISLHGLTEHGTSETRLASVDKREVLGKLLFRIPFIRWRPNTVWVHDWAEDDDRTAPDPEKIAAE